MNTGKLNKKVTVIYPGTMTKTATGGFTEGATTSKTVWARVDQLSQSEQLRNGLETSNVSYEVELNKLSVKNITRKCSLEYEANKLRIEDLNDNNDHTYILICNEQQ